MLVANPLMCPQFLQVCLKFLENILAVFNYRHIVKKVLQLPEKDTRAGKLQWKNDMAQSGYCK